MCAALISGYRKGHWSFKTGQKLVFSAWKRGLLKPCYKKDFWPKTRFKRAKGYLWSLCPDENTTEWSCLCLPAFSFANKGKRSNRGFVYIQVEGEGVPEGLRPLRFSHRQGGEGLREPPVAMFAPKTKLDTSTTNMKYRKFPNKGAVRSDRAWVRPYLKSRLTSFPTIYDNPYFALYRHIIYCWKALELNLKNVKTGDAPLLEVRPYYGI